MYISSTYNVTSVITLESLMYISSTYNVTSVITLESLMYISSTYNVTSVITLESLMYISSTYNVTSVITLESLMYISFLCWFIKVTCFLRLIKRERMYIGYCLLPNPFHLFMNKICLKIKIKMWIRSYHFFNTF
jgi:hypothetical protein